MATLIGTGTKILSIPITLGLRRARDWHIATTWITLLNLPLVPMKSYRVAYLGQRSSFNQTTYSFQFGDQVPFREALPNIVTTLLLFYVVFPMAIVLILYAAATYMPAVLRFILRV